MEGHGPLVNIGELSRPATVLVEKISDAVGGYFKPFQIRRVARAEADAEKIKALAELEISDLQRRALQRFVAEESRKQDNIETIASEAISDVNEDARPDEIEGDWITNFFDKARLISDAEMQRLWSKILSGEANAPGRFSKRTVNYLSSLDKEDANLFRSLLGFGWMIDKVVPLVFETRDTIYADAGINFTTLTHLDEIGLVSFENFAGFVKLNLPETFTVHYYGRPLVLERKQAEDSLDVGKVMLSKVGQQLAPIVNPGPVDGFFDYVVKRWESKGFTCSRPGLPQGRNGS